MEVKIFEYLPEEAKQIRTSVFIEEQGFNNEFDEIDDRATHLIVFEGEQPIATCRVFYEEENESYMLGRLAVMKEYRGMHIGEILLKEAENTIVKKGGNTNMLSAQVRAAQFYEKQGYQKQGEVYLDEGCPHVMMKKEL